MSNAAQSTPPRNIVLLSDGTGNSSAKLMKTNVWRIYEALDVSKGDQLAMYDNGVGTSSFKLFAVLGGALGWGLKRNVRDLYMFACRNWRPEEGDREADRLFTFGFSRGAFTIRVLVGLIEHQGLITGVRGPELKRRAKWAYREYRRQFNSTGGLVTVFRAIRDVVVRLVERRHPRYDKSQNTPVRVTFMGLWDTVDAYGLPIDEMTRGWDKWIWPLSMCERKVRSVDKICHAIALDDERHTFHPVLLDESDTPLENHTDKERVTQVWFAGMHSNVGGGYPDDSLAHVSLRWMAHEAGKKQLRLHQSVLDLWAAHVDPHGPISDSRGGIGSYYRYNPRSIQKLTNDRFADVSIVRPKIHHSVFERIAAGRDDYAPIVLPERYAVVKDDGAVVEGDGNPFEHPTQSRFRCAEQERAWNLVWVRRVFYFATVILTVLFVLPPLILSAATAEAAKATLTAWGVPEPGWAKALINALAPLAPAMFKPWVDFYSEVPELLALLAGPIVLLMLLSSVVQGALRERMRVLWSEVAAAPGKITDRFNPPTDVIYRLRSHPLYRGGFEVVTQRILPFIFGIGTLVAVAFVCIGLVSRTSFALASARGSVCISDGHEVTQLPEEPFLLQSRDPCLETHLKLEKGVTYQIKTSLPPDGWWDGGQHVQSLAGFSSGDNLRVLPFLPFRRVLSEQWFVPIARVGVIPTEHHALSTEEVIFTSRVSGPLFLFVNDAVLLVPRDYFYRNNDKGDGESPRHAKVFIRKIEPGATAGAATAGSSP